ncbi:MAG TPA: hypothetical protein VFZ32_00910 [Micromonosporaceae bacterium]
MTGPQQPPYGGQGGQWTGGGGEWQTPSDQTQYNAAPSSGGPAGYDQPQAYDQPGYSPPTYDQPNFNQPQAYEQYPRPGYTDQYSTPPAGYGNPYSAPPGPPGFPNPMAPNPMAPVPPVKQSNPVPWIIGGVAGLVVLGLVIVIGAVLLTAGGGSGGPGGNRSAGPGGGGNGLKYSGAKVNNACDLIDVESIQKWARNQDKEPQHSESKSEYHSSFNCSASYKGNEYDTARISMYASVGGASTNMRNSYDSSEKSAKGQTGTGRETGDVSGLGEDAYYYSFVSDSDYSSSIIYELGMVDGNLMVTINVSVFLGKSGGVDKGEVRKICEDNAKKVMDGLKA